MFRGDRWSCGAAGSSLFQGFESRPIVFGGRRATYVEPQRNITLAQALRRSSTPSSRSAARRRGSRATC